ncbi:MAG: epoxyqueuosine reductase [Methanomassiliicoccales archaeon]|nr:MAG: epoxyqueuosine reductase [Methanomassiliicoccales archaeon]
MSKIRSEIEGIVRDCVSKEYIIGFSYLEGLLPKKYESLVYGITIGIKLDDKIIDKIVKGPTLEYARHYNRTNNTLNKVALEVKNILTGHRRKAAIIKSTLDTKEEKNYPNYYETLSVDFSHKTAATRSGLGWIGKTALFVSPRYGPRMRLVTVLTSQKMETGQPVKKSLCGDCDICVKKCPAQASNGRLWSVDMQREDFFDAFSCRSTAKELTKKRLKKDDALCGICVAVCPIGTNK